MRKFVWFLLVLGSLGILQAQEDEEAGIFGRGFELLKLGEHDGGALMEAWLRPVTERLLYQSVAAGYEPFRRREDRRLDVSVRVAYLHAGKKRTEIPLSELGLENWEPQDVYNLNLRTAISNDTVYSTTTFLISKLKDSLDNAAFVYETPAGFHYRRLPLFYFSAVYTLTPSTNLQLGTTFLYPKLLDLPFFMLSAGVQQNILPLLGKEADRSEVNLLFQYGYQHAEQLISILPTDNDVYSNAPVIGSHNGPYDHQKVLADLHAFSLGAVYAYKFTRMVRAYGGLRYMWGTAVYRFKGTFPAYRPAANGLYALEKYDMTDPGPVRGGYGSFSGGAGLWLEGEVLTADLRVEYGKYPSVHLGVGIRWQGGSSKKE